MLIEKIIAFSLRTEGRDKLLKTLQYLSKIIPAILTSNNSNRFNNLFAAIRDSRKFFRLGKTFVEIHYIIKLLEDTHIDSIQRFLAILGNISMAIRWIFDNVSLLSSVKVLKLDHKEVNKLATGF